MTERATIQQQIDEVNLVIINRKAWLGRRAELIAQGKKVPPDTGCTAATLPGRVAAKERLSASPKSPRTARDPDAPTPLPDLVEYRSVVIRRCADHFRGKWRDVWPNAHRPDHPDCTLPEEIIDEARAIIAAEEAAMAEPGGLARLHGYVPDSPRRPIQPVH